jgi:alpha-glucoside transport system substrate-binding protein
MDYPAGFLQLFASAHRATGVSLYNPKEDGMPLYNRHQREKVDELVEEFSQNKLGRREFVQRALAVGLSVSAATSLLAACGASPTTSGTVTKTTSVDLLNVWSGEEQASFAAVVAPFEKQTGISVKIETTRDVVSELTTRIRGNDVPDMAILPNPGYMLQLAKQNKLIALDSFLNMSQIKNDYAQSWIDNGSYNSHMYALFYKASNKATVWYNPKQFQAANYQTPTTWAELITLSNKIAQSGKFPWSMGVSSAGGSSGWPAADLVAQIYLNQNGGDLYSKWWQHQIPWTDPTISTAIQTFGQIAAGNHYISGAPESILATDYQSASYLPFKSDPGAYLYYEADFVEGFITAQFPSAKPGTDFNFFQFPSINPQFAGATTYGADVVVALRNTTAVQQLVKYMATAQAQEIWVKRGGFTSPNKSVDLSSYPDTVAQASARALSNAPLVAFGADDMMPSAMETAFWKGMLSYIQSPGQLSSILSSLESTAQQAYSS